MFMAAFFPSAGMAIRARAYTRTLALACRALNRHGERDPEAVSPLCGKSPRHRSPRVSRRITLAHRAPVQAGEFRRRTEPRGPLASRRDRLGHHGGVLC